MMADSKLQRCWRLPSIGSPTFPGYLASGPRLSLFIPNPISQFPRVTETCRYNAEWREREEQRERAEGQIKCLLLLCMRRKDGDVQCAACVWYSTLMGLFTNQSWLNFAKVRIELLTSKFMNHHQLFMFTVKERRRRRRDGK